MLKDLKTANGYFIGCNFLFSLLCGEQAYSTLPTEAGPDSAPGTLPEDWPQNGEIEFVHYTMAYREDLPPVLNDLCFKVRFQKPTQSELSTSIRSPLSEA